MRVLMIAATAGFLATAVFSGQAMAANKAPSKMQQCAAQWQDMKKSGQDKGTTYKAFSSTCMKGAAAPAVAAAPAPAAKPAPMAPMAMNKPSAPAMPASMPMPAVGQTKMQQCAASWQQLKAQNKTNGMDYRSYSSSCMKGGATVAMAPSAPAMAKPAATKTTMSNMPMPAGGKMSQQDRMRSCAAKWDQMKASHSTNGMTYRQFSSNCLKTH